MTRQAAFANEAAMAAWWRSGVITGHDLRPGDGSVIRVIFPGWPGGSVGPDFRHAVITIDGRRRVGAIELHLRPSGWHGHGHDIDPAYNAVILHVVAGGPLPPAGVTALASGGTVPVVMVNDLATLAHAAPDAPIWPCTRGLLPHDSLLRWLRQAGAARFEQRVARFRQELTQANGQLDAVLIAAIAEALGYGRQPMATRLVAQHILTGQVGDGTQLDALSSRRVRTLTQLVAGWRSASPAARCCGTLLAGGTAQGWERLVALLAPSGVNATNQTVGRQRAAIVVWNAILPCLAAYGDACGNVALSRVARQVAQTAPGLPSNTITRAMTRWLRLKHAPAGALAQQGLHHLHAQWCGAKTCESCPVGQMAQSLGYAT